MLETEQSSPSRVLSPIRDESSGEDLTVLPRHTKVIVIGNNRTKSVLVGLQGVVKKAVGLGGWHWLVLKNGVEVKLQRNALSVLEPPTGDEIDDDDENMPDNFSCDSDLGEKRTVIHELSATTIDFHKLSKPRVRHTKPWVHSSSKSPQRRIYMEVQSNIRVLESPKVNLGTLGMNSLWRYCRRYKLRSVSHNPSKEQMIYAVQRHFASQQLNEIQVIQGFVRAAKRLRKIESEYLNEP